MTCANCPLSTKATLDGSPDVQITRCLLTGESRAFPHTCFCREALSSFARQVGGCGAVEFQTLSPIHDGIAGVSHGVSFMGLRMGQNQNAAVAFDTLFKHVNADDRLQRIIELGTWAGGLSVLFSLYAIATNAEFYTYDLVDSRSPGTKDLFERLRIDYRRLDLTGDIEEVTSLLRLPGVTLLVLDAPSVPEAKHVLFERCCRVMKPHDLIAVHDYAPSKDYWEQHMRGRVFDFCEFDDEIILERSAGRRIEPVLSDVFLPAAWFCGKFAS